MRRRGGAGPGGLWSLKACLLGPGLTLIVASIMAPLYLSSVRPPADRIVDFYQEWASARNYREGLPVYASHHVTIPRYLGLQIARPQDLSIEVNAHPPTSVLVALPFTLLHYRDAVFAWNLASLLMLGVSLVVVWRGFGISFSPWWIFPLVTSLLVCAPLVMQLFFAQLSLLILLLLTGTWAADRSGRPLLAGVLLGMAGVIKLFPGFLLYYFVLRRQWKSLFAAVATVLLLTGLTVAVLGVESYRSYIEDVLPRVSEFRGKWNNASLGGFWIKLFDPPSVKDTRVEALYQSKWLARFGILSSYTAVVVALTRIVRRAATPAQQDVAFGLSIIAMLLVSPITWDHYLLLLLIPIAATWIHLPRSPLPRVVFAATLVALWSPPLIVQHFIVPGGATRGIAKHYHTLTIMSYQCYALIALFVLGILICKKHGDGLADDSSDRKQRIAI
jgi:Glycosyltransferase family 87